MVQLGKSTFLAVSTLLATTTFTKILHIFNQLTYITPDTPLLVERGVSLWLLLLPQPLLPILKSRPTTYRACNSFKY